MPGFDREFELAKGWTIGLKWVGRMTWEVALVSPDRKKVAPLGRHPEGFWADWAKDPAFLEAVAKELQVSTEEAAEALKRAYQEICVRGIKRPQAREPKEGEGKKTFSVHLDGDRVLTAWKEGDSFRVSLVSLQEGEGVLWQDTQGVPFWRGERKKKETFGALQKVVPDLTEERFGELVRELAEAEKAGRIPEFEEEEGPPAAFVPCLVTEEFIAEECWDREKEEAFFLVRHFGDGKIERADFVSYNGVEYRPLVNPHLKKGMVLLPSGVEPCTLAEAFQEACDLALTMYDAEEEKKEEIKFLTAVALSSWFLDRFNMQVPGMGAFAPIIALRGPSGSGKDRLLNALRLVSYRPFYDVSTTRVPSLYRPMDQWRGTLCLSEMDFKNTGETSELTHYLNCRAYGVPIGRQNPDSPKYSEVFHNFGLTIVTQRRVWDDNATEDRSLPFYCERTQKEVPPEVLDEWVERGLRLQNKLLYLRLTLWERVVIDKRARVRGVKDHRLNAAIQPLIALSKLEPSLGSLLEENLRKMEKRRREVKALSKDGVLINRIYELWKEGLTDEHNGTKLILVRRTREDEEGNKWVETVPLQVSDLAETLEWTGKEVRKVLNSLQLHPQLESLPKVIRWKDGRSYRPIWIDEGRLKSRFEEFVPDYVQEEATEGTDEGEREEEPTHEPLTDGERRKEAVTDVTDGGERKEEPVPAPLADGEGEEQKAVTDVTDVTDSMSVGGISGEDARTEGPTQRLSVTSVTSVTEERPSLAPEGGKKVPPSEEGLVPINPLKEIPGREGEVVDLQGGRLVRVPLVPGRPVLVSPETARILVKGGYAEYVEPPDGGGREDAGGS
jgi:hypothetical protein